MDKTKPFITRLPLEALVLIFFVAVYAVLFLIFRGQFTYHKHGVTVPLVLMMILTVVASVVSLWRRRGEADRWWGTLQNPLVIIKDWLPVPLLILIYENLHDLTNLIRPNIVDNALMGIDQWLFGVQPTIWMQKIISPYLTDYMMFAYTMYFFWPAILLGLFYIRGRKEEFHMLMVALTFCFYIGFLGYILVPAVGPRYIMQDVYTERLVGVFLYHKANTVLNSFEAVKRDCFPSLHTAVSTVVLFFAWRVQDLFKIKRIIFWIMAPLIFSLYFSTVYLRQHWVVDIFAGWLHAYLTYKLGIWAYNKWSTKMTAL